MNAKTKERVIELLKTYPERKREIEVLRCESAHPAHTSQKEQITAMALPAMTAWEGPAAIYLIKPIHCAQLSGANRQIECWNFR